MIYQLPREGRAMGSKSGDYYRQLVELAKQYGRTVARTSGNSNHYRLDLPGAQPVFAGGTPRNVDVALHKLRIKLRRAHRE